MSTTETQDSACSVSQGFESWFLITNFTYKPIV